MLHRDLILFVPIFGSVSDYLFTEGQGSLPHQEEPTELVFPGGSEQKGTSDKKNYLHACIEKLPQVRSTTHLSTELLFVYRISQYIRRTLTFSLQILEKMINLLKF
jgi:hypothetical protein